jgi:hypothetical protein
VRSQRFVFGRDATWLPAKNVFKEVDETQPPLTPENQLRGWDLRLNWQQPRSQLAEK